MNKNLNNQSDLLNTIKELKTKKEIKEEEYKRYKKITLKMKVAFSLAPILLDIYYFYIGVIITPTISVQGIIRIFLQEIILLTTLNIIDKINKKDFDKEISQIDEQILTNQQILNYEQIKNNVKNKNITKSQETNDYKYNFNNQSTNEITKNNINTQNRNYHNSKSLIKKKK